MDAPAAGDIIEPRTRTFITWTPALLRAAEIAADGGDLLLAADLCETMLADDRIKAVVDTRTDTLLGLDLSFEGRAKRPVVRLDEKEDWWAMCPETDLKLLHAWGIMLGVGLARIVWSKIDGRDMPRLSIKNPRNLRFDDNDLKWKFQPRTGPEITIDPGDGLWILYTPYGSVRPWAFGAYRALSRWCLLKQYALSDWALHSETKGQGLLIATGAEGSREQRLEIANDLRNMARRAALALPKGFDLKLIESVAKSWDTFDAQIKAADNGYAITILGQNLTTQAGNTGNQAATLHGQVALGRTKADSETLSTTLHDQMLTWWAEFNFGDRSVAPWPCWDTKALADKKAAADVEMQRAQATATLVGAKIMTVNEARARHDLPLIKGGDEMVMAPPPAPPPPEQKPPEPAPASPPDENADSEAA